WRFWYTHGHLSEGRAWLVQALAGAAPLPPIVRARALNGAGVLTLRQGDPPQAAILLEESLALWRSLGDTMGEVRALNNLGLVALVQSDYPQARSYFEQSLAGW